MRAGRHASKVFGAARVFSEQMVVGMHERSALVGGVGRALGSRVGDMVGAGVGAPVGVSVGTLVGAAVGGRHLVGDTVGADVGSVEESQGHTAAYA